MSSTDRRHDRRHRSEQVADPVVNMWVDGTRRCTAELAANRRDRRVGLLGRTGVDGVLVLEPCRSVHTLRMRFAIDVAHLDRVGRVLRITTMPPNRLGVIMLRARTVVEAEAGMFERWQLGPGSEVEFK